VDASGDLVPGGPHVDGGVDALPGHPDGWADPWSPAFHGPSGANVAACLACHAARPPATVAALTCSFCHDEIAGGRDWTTTCDTCHGSAAGPAPDSGAHASHLEARHGIAPPLDCPSCHQVPANVLSQGHLDGTVTVTGYQGSDPRRQATMVDPGWSAPAQSCATAYCHGATLEGGTATSPIWTVGGGSQVACGTCHGVPPASYPSPDHPRYVFDAPCAGCHPATATLSVAGGNAIVAGGGAHVDASIEFTFAGHPTGWADMGDALGGIHGRNTWNGAGALTMDDYFTQCTSCHGSGGSFSPGGGTSRVSCGACHPAFFDQDGGTSCTFCH
jgi:predicted CxxxxCH...CXXCH cytochrome family protein